MFEQDYIMRLIKEMIRAILKLLFNVDTDNPIENLMEDKESQSTLEKLLDMVDNGNINEAEICKIFRRKAYCKQCIDMV